MADSEEFNHLVSPMIDVIYRYFFRRKATMLSNISSKDERDESKEAVIVRRLFKQCATPKKGRNAKTDSFCKRYQTAVRTSKRQSHVAPVHPPKLTSPISQLQQEKAKASNYLECEIS